MPRTATSSRSPINNRLLIRNFTKSLSLNGTTTYLTCPITPLTTGLSLGLWINLLKISAQQRIVAWTAGGPNGGFFLEKATSGTGKTLHFDVYNGASQQADIVSKDIGISEWHHVVCTFINNEAKLYVDSVLQNTDTSCVMSTPSSQTLTIGRSSSASSAFMQGLIDEFIFQNTTTPWTQTQVNSLYYRGIIPSGAEVIYNFNDNVNDQSGNGHDGTLTSGSYSTVTVSSPRSQA